MAVTEIVVVSGSTSVKEVKNTTRSITVSNVRNTVQQGAGAQAVSVVRPGGTVANVTYGEILPPNPAEGQIFILIT